MSFLLKPHSIFLPSSCYYEQAFVKLYDGRGGNFASYQESARLVRRSGGLPPLSR
jgi:hypothetical protein